MPASLKSLTDILNWKLLADSHDWPGPDGGTCINEAAIVAAGFPYTSVRSHEDCPPCFSPVLSAYLLQLNDAMDCDARQKLMPFVTRLAGSRDSWRVELNRMEQILLDTARYVIGPRVREGVCWETLPDIYAAYSEARHRIALMERSIGCVVAQKNDVRTLLMLANFQTAFAHLQHLCALSVSGEGPLYGPAALSVGHFANAVISAYGPYDACIKIAKNAFSIGKQAGDVDIAAVAARMEAMKQTKAPATAE